MQAPKGIFLIIFIFSCIDFVLIKLFYICVNENSCPNNIFVKTFIVLQIILNISLSSYYLFHFFSNALFNTRGNFIIQLLFLCFIVSNLIYSFFIFRVHLLVNGMLYYYLQLCISIIYTLAIYSIFNHTYLSSTIELE